MNDKGQPHYFVSFWSGNNERPGPSNRKRGQRPGGWVDQFDFQLKADFGEKIRGGFSRTFYKENKEPGEISDYIKREIEKSDLLIAVASLNMYESKRCKEERDYFRDWCERKYKDKSANRTFIVRLDQSDLPTDLAHCNAEKFCSTLDDGTIQKLGHPYPDISEDLDFYYATQRLAQGMAERCAKLFPHLVRMAAMPDHGRALGPKYEQSVYVEGLPEDSSFVCETAQRLAYLGFRKERVRFSPQHLESERKAQAAKKSAEDKKAAGESKSTGASDEIDPLKDFYHWVDTSDIVLVVLKDGEFDSAETRRIYAEGRFEKLKKPQENVLFINAGAERLTPDDCAKRLEGKVKVRSR